MSTFFSNLWYLEKVHHELNVRRVKKIWGELDIKKPGSRICLSNIIYTLEKLTWAKFTWQVNTKHFITLFLHRDFYKTQIHSLISLSKQKVRFLVHRLVCNCCILSLPHSNTSSPLNKMAAILQTTILSTYSWMKMLVFRLKYHWSLLLRVQLTIRKHWFG